MKIRRVHALEFLPLPDELFTAHCKVNADSSINPG